jgi:hypothetical protein
MLPTVSSGPNVELPTPMPQLSEGLATVKVEKLRRRKRDRMLYNFWLPLGLGAYSNSYYKKKKKGTEPEVLLI